jgi:hypothetical protein
VFPDDDMKFFIKHAPMIYTDTAKEICKHDIDYWFRSGLSEKTFLIKIMLQGDARGRRPPMDRSQLLSPQMSLREPQ